MPCTFAKSPGPVNGQLSLAGAIPGRRSWIGMGTCRINEGEGLFYGSRLVCMGFLRDLWSHRDFRVLAIYLDESGEG